jgi:predicted DNA-binding transcriptional regulator AlpA
MTETAAVALNTALNDPSDEVEGRIKVEPQDEQRIEVAEVAAGSVFPSLPPPARPPSRHHIDRRAGALIDKEVGSPDDLLSTSEVAEWLGVSTQFLEIGRVKNYGPKFCRLSTRRVRYLRSAVRAWLAERTHNSTAEYGRKLGSRDLTPAGGSNEAA